MSSPSFSSSSSPRRRIALVSVVKSDDSIGGQFLIWDGAHATETYVPSMAVGAVAVKVDPEGLVHVPAYAGSVDSPDTKRALASRPSRLTCKR